MHEHDVRRVARAGSCSRANMALGRAALVLAGTLITALQPAAALSFHSPMQRNQGGATVVTSGTAAAAAAAIAVSGEADGSDKARSGEGPRRSGAVEAHVANGVAVVRPSPGVTLTSAVRACADVAAAATPVGGGSSRGATGSGNGEEVGGGDGAALAVSTVHCVLDADRLASAGSDVSHGAPGTIALPPLRVPLVITSADPGRALTGIQWLPAERWAPAPPSPHRTLRAWQQTLPPGFATESGAVEQLIAAVDGGGLQWMPEARWPNVKLGVGAPANAPGGPLDPSSWATTKQGTSLRNGTIVDPALPRGVDWTGAVATLNVGFRFLTWTRTVLSSVGDTFRYDSNCASTGHVGGKGNYLDFATGNLYFLTGVLGALDSPGEWLYNDTTRVLTVITTDGQPPGGRVGVRVKDYCLDLTMSDSGAPVSIANASLTGCTFRLRNCRGCAVDGVNVTFPTYQRTIAVRGVQAGGAPPAVTTLVGNGSSVTRTSVRYTNGGGIKIVGSNNTITECLLEDLTWYGSLDFPGIELGFGETQPTLAQAVGDADAKALTSGEGGAAATVGDAGGKASTSEKRGAAAMATRVVAAAAAASVVSAAGERAPGGLRGLPAPDRTVGNDNRVLHTTVRRVGEMGILTSQRSNEIAHTHVHHAGLIGLDSAALHADNTFVSCMNFSLPLGERANCTKTWHHNWVHDATEKCVRNDDYGLNLTVHHTVIFNCGNDRSRNAHAATGCILKGDSNAFYQNTVFNVSAGPGGVGTQGDLCAATAAVNGTAGGRYALPRQNTRSVFYNSVAQNVTTQGGGPGFDPTARHFARWEGMWRDESRMRLVDPGAFDFRPAQGSPLVGAGAGGADVGAYRHDDETPWSAGCTFSPRCLER